MAADFHSSPCPSDEFEVEQILAQKTEQGQTWFLVDWKGYPVEAATWEPEQNILGQALLADWGKRKLDIQNGKCKAFDVQQWESHQKIQIGQDSEERQELEEQRESDNSFSSLFREESPIPEIPVTEAVVQTPRRSSAPEIGRVVSSPISTSSRVPSGRANKSKTPVSNQTTPKKIPSKRQRSPDGSSGRPSKKLFTTPSMYFWQNKRMNREPAPDPNALKFFDLSSSSRRLTNFDGTNQEKPSEWLERVRVPRKSLENSSLDQSEVTADPSEPQPQPQPAPQLIPRKRGMPLREYLDRTKKRGAVQDEPLQPPHSKQPSKVITCRFWAKGHCKYSQEDCPYLHAEGSESHPSKAVTCSFWAKGHCMYSQEQCQYLHAETTEVAHEPCNGKPLAAPSRATSAIGEESQSHKKRKISHAWTGERQIHSQRYNESLPVQTGEVNWAASSAQSKETAQASVEQFPELLRHLGGQSHVHPSRATLVPKDVVDEDWRVPDEVNVCNDTTELEEQLKKASIQAMPGQEHVKSHTDPPLEASSQKENVNTKNWSSKRTASEELSQVKSSIARGPITEDQLLKLSNALQKDVKSEDDLERSQEMREIIAQTNQSVKSLLHKGRLDKDAAQRWYEKLAAQILGQDVNEVLTSTVDGSNLERKVFLLVPPGHHPELPLLYDLFYGLRFSIFESTTAGAWSIFAKKYGSRSGIVIVHPSVIDIYMKLPRLTDLLRGRFNFYRLNIPSNDNDGKVLTPAFPSGICIQITDGMWRYRPEDCLSVINMLNDISSKQPGFKVDLFTRSNIKKWTRQLITEAESGSEVNKGKLFRKLYEVVFKLSSPPQRFEDFVEMQESSRPREERLFSPHADFMYSELYDESKSKAYDWLAEYFANWAIRKSTKYRFFIIVHHERQVEWKEKWHHVVVTTPSTLRDVIAKASKHRL